MFLAISITMLYILGGNYKLIFPLLLLSLAPFVVFYSCPVFYFTLLRSLLSFFSPFTRNTVQLDDTLVCSYLERGSVESTHETVVMLHGYSCMNDDYIDVAKDLDESFHLLIIDWLNHGDSTVLNKTVNTEDAVAFMHKFMGKMRLGDRKVHLIGHSTGGYLIIQYAARFPDRVASLSLLSPLGVVMSSDEYWLRSVFSRQHVSDEDFISLLDFSSSGTFKPHPIPFVIRALRHQRNMMASAHKKVFDGIVESAKLTKEIMVDISSLPSILVWGDNDKLLLTRPGVDFFREHSPNTEVHIVDNCGHIMLHTHAKQVFELLQKWLTKNSRKSQ